MLNLNLLTKLCLNEIDKINININKKRYKPKYSNEYYISMIFNLLNDINNWKFLKNIKKCVSTFKFHYKTIYNKFRYWTNKNIFKNAFKNYYSKFNNNLLMIDATSINNQYGSENIVINPEYKKKKITKLSIISNKNGFIYSIINCNIKNKYKNYSTSVHDVKTINNSINEITNINNKSKYFILLGDKAYKTKDKFKLLNKPIKIITPDKINSKIKNLNSNNKKLKLRIKVENVINSIKKFNRIKIRKDRNIKYYLSWVYLSCLINNINVNI